MGLFGSITHAVTDTVSDGLDAVSDGFHAVEHGVSDAVGWVGDHWKQIAVIGTAVVVGTVVTIATGGAGAPLIAALAAGGFAGGASADVVSSLLDGKNPSLLHALRAGAISSVISVGTFGLGKLATPAVTRLLAPSATRAIASAADAIPGVDAGAADAAAGATDAATGAAGAAASDFDPVTAKVLADYGLTPETRLFRVTDPEFVDLENGTVAGNPHSIALVQDPYAPMVEHPLSVAGRAEDPSLPRILIPQQALAKDLGPSLNVSTADPSAYAKPGFVKVELSLGDVLANGGRVYRDIGAAQSHAYIVTIPDSVPVRAITAPTGHVAEGLPLPSAGPSTEKVEAYVRGALKSGASAGRTVVSGTAGGSGGGAPHASAPSASPSRSAGFIDTITKAAKDGH